MTSARRALPALVLGVTSLDLPVAATRDRTLEVAGRFREPESLAVTLVKALDAGAGAVYAVPSARFRAALRELSRPVPVLARLPLTPPAADLHHDHPLLLAPGPGDESGAVSPAGLLARLALLPGLLAGDFAARVATRAEREAPRFGARAWAGVAIAAAVTDLALAADHAVAFERLLRWGRARFGCAGFETQNLGTLLPRLSAWGIEPDFVLGAFNPRGYAMKPDGDGVLAAMRASAVPVLASELRAGGTVALAEGAAWARARGARGLLADLVDLDDVAAELGALRAAAR